MSAEPRNLRTEAEQTLAEQYRAVRERLPGSKAVHERRDAAMALFERTGLPHRRVEAWKYTDLRALMRKAAPLAEASSAEAAGPAVDRLPGLDRYRLVIADGHFQEGLSDRAALLAEGVEIATLAEFLGFDSASVLGILDPPAGAADDAMVTLNAALATDGVVILVPEGRTVSKPIEIVQRSTGSTPTATFTRNAVQIGRDAGVTILLTRDAPDGVAHQINSVMGIAAAEGSKGTVVDLQLAGAATQDIATTSVRLAAGSTVNQLSVSSGASLARSQSFVVIEGEGAHFGAYGATMLRGTARNDTALIIDHASPNSTSRVLYKNIADEEADGAFQGRIVVQPVAQKTDGRMMVNTLILSDLAEFSAKPELEIYADDVQCGHGATTGQFDETILFYLLSRGIPRAVAEGLLLKAFLSEAVEAIGHSDLTEAIELSIDAWLEARAS